MKKIKKEQRISRITKMVTSIIEEVSSVYAPSHQELKVFEGFRDIKYMPDPFEIADYYGISYKYIYIEGDIPSYFNRELKTIFISNRYRQHSYEARLLCAHELGHFFLHDSHEAAMNNDILNYYLPMETMKEYEANVFAILIYPQIMAGKQWQSYSPKILNRKMHKKSLKEDG